MDSHSPVQPPTSRQYASIIFFHDEDQRRSALASKQREEIRRGRRLSTEVVPAGEFYLAEDYHQKYYLQNTNALMQEYGAIYPDIDDFISSTATARVNGYLGGHASREQLEQEIGELGLSPQGQQTLRDQTAL